MPEEESTTSFSFCSKNWRRSDRPAHKVVVLSSVIPGSASETAVSQIFLSKQAA